MGGLDLHLDLHAGDGRQRALEMALREAVRSGRLRAGTRLPGSRSLAADLGLSRGTVVQAYSQLIAEGWLLGKPGSGTVASHVPAPAQPAPAPPAPSIARPSAIDLRPGRPDLDTFPRAVWAAAVRRALAGSSTALDYGEPAGLPVLRAALAEHVSRTRGVRASAETVIVTAGFSQALALLGRAVRGLGMSDAAVEDPGFARHRELLRAAGLRLSPLPVDAEGPDPAGLPARPALVLLTPAHQHPCGVVLAPARRAAFVDRARRDGAILVEDDYDGEFRYDGQPVGAMQPLDPDRVVFGGSASKTLAPGLRLAWLVVPPALRQPLLDAVVDTGTTVPVIEQLALADLIRRGDLDRHVRRVRRAYRERREQLAARLADVSAPPLAGVAAGLHALLPLESADREHRLVAAARRAGVQLHGLHTAGYWHLPDPERQAALVLGYATPPAHAWRRSLDALAALLSGTPAG
ncbi:MocR-like pyridoxine biosynthesis transcription factor PdxR [Pseudonocardia nigra]|uniref:MocR-like pyridoxine biosynthesis transcription factor PdxR n=1 Tax=Pseudonocardia nigra TaxID=1921578 RepID=UPI0027E228EF|nr:PLP-dependent aminotransferase family protein [Pseudonocardia nigra]